MKRQETPSEAHLADMIMRDIAQLAEDAKAQGVTAYLRQPVHRKKPNERFLQGTLRSVAFANRKAEEDEMWAHRNKRLRRSDRGPQRPAGRNSREGRSDGHSSESDSRGSDSAETSSQAEPSEALSDSELAHMLSRRHPRGRGAVGSRADEPGPFLPESALADVGPDDFTA
ncbi:hypothetical protein WJX75_001262 [Coccomyxa subellipsoidea]|uniref:Uncharacterized protein n=1 Tax=Coccomyxa subellipsoidea TaxID=248742 RepID=A0ABR2YLT3_9CHLO